MIIDSNYTLIINIPDKLPPNNDDEVSSNTANELPKCGWLLEEVEKKYAQLVKELK